MTKKKAPTKKTVKTSDDDVAPPFEHSLAELRMIVSALEQGNLTLSDSLEQYENGVRSLKNCYRALDEAQSKIEILIDLDDDGRLVTAPFDGSATGFNSGRLNDPGNDGSDDGQDDAREDDEENADVDDPNRLF